MFPSPSLGLTKQFLEFVDYDQGGRLFTYVLTLDGLWRFTETGEEFRIDMLSKHTLHSNVSIYIAYAGEFFVRRLKHRHGRRDRSSNLESTEISLDPQTQKEGTSITPKDPSAYELIIDNDSGTYRPNGDYLPELKQFISTNLPGLQVTTLDCQKDSERMKRLKSEHRLRKKAHGRQMVYLQDRSGSSSSISSSDESVLDRHIRE